MVFTDKDGNVLDNTNDVMYDDDNPNRPEITGVDDRNTLEITGVENNNDNTDTIQEIEHTQHIMQQNDKTVKAPTT